MFIGVVGERPLVLNVLLMPGEGRLPSWLPPRIASLVHDVFKGRHAYFRYNVSEIAILDCLPALLLTVVGLGGCDRDDSVLLFLSEKSTPPAPKIIFIKYRIPQIEAALKRSRFYASYKL